MPEITRDIGNELVAQKNAIMTKINNAEDCTELRAAYDLLLFAQDIWFVAGYGYKVIEVVEAIKLKAKTIASSESEYLRHARKNDRSRASTEAHLRQLELLENLSTERRQKLAQSKV